MKISCPLLLSFFPHWPSCSSNSPSFALKFYIVYMYVKSKFCIGQHMAFTFSSIALVLLPLLISSPSSPHMGNFLLSCHIDVIFIYTCMFHILNINTWYLSFWMWLFFYFFLKWFSFGKEWPCVIFGSNAKKILKTWNMREHVKSLSKFIFELDIFGWIYMYTDDTYNEIILKTL